MVFGTFDLLHKGHKYFLKNAKEQGDELIVIIARDNNVKKLKGKTPKHNQDQRKQAIGKLGYKAIIGNNNDFYKVIENEKPDIICLGYDQDPLNLKKELKKRKLNPMIIILSPFEEHIYKTSLLK